MFIERFQAEIQFWWDSIVEQSPYFVLGLLFFLFFLFIGKFFKSFFIKRFAKRLNDPLLSNFLGNILLWVFIILGSVVFLNQLGLGKAATGMLAGAGLTAIIFGFAFKDLGENLLSGVMLAFSRPFNIGDIIELKGYVGEVKSLKLRNTHIRTFNGKDIYIPNSTTIKEILTNFTKDGLLRHDFIIGIDYNESLKDVFALIEKTLAEEVVILHNKDLEPFIAIDQFAASTINIKIHFWIDSKNYVGSNVLQKTQVMAKVVKALIDANIHLPADIIDLKIYNDAQPIPLHIQDGRQKEKDSN
jgi:small-conductance mechanosensitive channel